MANDRIEFECDECGKLNSVPAEYAGRTGRCSGCKEAIQVPGERLPSGRTKATSDRQSRPSSRRASTAKAAGDNREGPPRALLIGGAVIVLFAGGALYSNIRAKEELKAKVKERREKAKLEQLLRPRPPLPVAKFDIPLLAPDPPPRTFVPEPDLPASVQDLIQTPAPELPAGWVSVALPAGWSAALPGKPEVLEQTQESGPNKVPSKTHIRKVRSGEGLYMLQWQQLLDPQADWGIYFHKFVGGVQSSLTKRGLEITSETKTVSKRRGRQALEVTFVAEAKEQGVRLEFHLCLVALGERWLFAQVYTPGKDAKALAAREVFFQSLTR